MHRRKETVLRLRSLYSISYKSLFSIYYLIPYKANYIQGSSDLTTEVILVVTHLITDKVPFALVVDPISDNFPQNHKILSVIHTNKFTL